MKLVERDLKIMMFINDFGYVRTGVLSKLFFKSESEVSQKKGAERRLRQLRVEGFVVKDRDYRSNEYIYRLTRKGINELSALGFKTFSFIPNMRWPSWVHNNMVQEVLLEFKKAGLGQFVSERTLRSLDIFGKNIPDLVVAIDPDNWIAVEVELEQKAQDRLKKKLSIFENHSKRIKSLFYINSNETISRKLNEVYRNLYIKSPKLTTVEIDEFFANSEMYIEEVVSINMAEESILNG